MHEPEIFSKFNHGTRDGAEAALGKMGHLIKWKPDHSDTILDIGCGPGNITVDVFLNHFNGKFSKAYGTDISRKMIEFAAEKYSDRKDVQFLQMDICKEEEVDGFLGKHGHLDHVVSSFVVHWMLDQEQGLKNIWKLLKPGGDFLTVHCCYTTLYEIYGFMESSPKWQKYFSNLATYIPPSQTSKQPEKEFHEQLIRCGYTDIALELRPNVVTMNSMEDVKSLMGTVLAQIHNVPEELRKEFIDDVIDFGVKNGVYKVMDDGKVSFVFDLFIAHMKKP